MSQPGKLKTCAIDPLRFGRNTIQIGSEYKTIGGWPARMGFFTCVECDFKRGDYSGVMLEGNTYHECEKCGRSMIMWIRL